MKLPESNENRPTSCLHKWGHFSRPVPAWMSGDFMPRGLATERLLSGLLCRLDEEAWLDFMDRLPLPTTMETLLLDTNIEREKPERLLDWIRQSRLAFDGEGRRTSSALVYVLERMAIGLIKDDLMRRCAELDDEIEIQAALSSGIVARQQLVTVIKSREDSNDLLAELSARCMIMAQSNGSESPLMLLQHKLYFILGLEYAKALGNSEEALEKLKRREAIDHSRSRLGLWLAASARTEPSDTEFLTEEQSKVLNSCWSWLLELMVKNDSGLPAYYGEYNQWTERLAGICLVCTTEPLSSLEEAWGKLAPQRLTPKDDRYSRGDWAASRFLIRAAYHAYHFEKEDLVAMSIWRAAMSMALSAWLSIPVLGQFAEVSYGLGHLAIGDRKIDGEPGNTFKYLIGLPHEVICGASMLLDNGTTPETLLSATNEAGIDLGIYLTVNKDQRLKEQVQKIRQALFAHVDEDA